METDFGPLHYRPGDYLVIPRGTVYRVLPAERNQFLVVESFSEFRFPEKGMLGQHALFDPAVIKTPTPDPAKAPLMPKNGEEYELVIQRQGKLTSVYYPTPPITTVGWKGDLTVQQINVADIRPVLSDRYHLPPSAHTTFVAQGFVVCTFLPRPLENGDPEAMKVPFYHSNIDYDEVLFYHAGEFFSRTGIEPGMLTFHPQGIHHGPQPGAVERSRGAKRTEEVAVMIDTQRPLNPTRNAEEVEWKDYWRSWK
jgi:homogentisate 1,2-dioxygenase